MNPSSPLHPPGPRGAASRAAAPEGGFVLLEILMALVIFATLVLAYAKATDNALEAAAEANSDRTLRLLASRKLSEIRAKPAAFLEGGEGGFEEEVDAGQENPFVDYRWKVESQEVVAAGFSAEQNAVFLFTQDGSDSTSTPASGDAKNPDPVLLQRLILTVSRVPEGSDESDRMRVVTFVLAPPKEGAQGAGN